MLVVVLLLIVVSAVPALVSAFVARGGAVFRLLGIAVVGQDGREVSRLRGLARALIAWTPGIAALVLLLPFGTLWSIEEGPVGQLTPSLLLLAVFVAGAVFALFNQNQGLQDRITRTSLVARRPFAAGLSRVPSAHIPRGSSAILPRLTRRPMALSLPALCFYE